MRSWLLILTCLVTASCSSDTPKRYLTPFSPEKKVEDDGNFEEFDPEADILFVVDDSGSMDTHQQNLSENITKFTSTFLKTSALDYNIGVITTDRDGNYGTSKCCGRLIGSPRVISKSTPNADMILQGRLMVGTGGSGLESPFDTASIALSPGMLASDNAGFIREKAALIVIFITDAEDQSVIEGSKLLEDLVALKNGDRRKVLSYGAIIPTATGDSCERDEEGKYPQKIEQFLKMAPNAAQGENTVSLCDTGFGQTLADWALQIVEQVGSVIYLSRKPIEGTIRVTYGTMDLPNDFETGYIYNPKTNAIHLGRKIDWEAQPPGSRIKIHYEEAPVIP